MEGHASFMLLVAEKPSTPEPSPLGPHAPGFENRKASVKKSELRTKLEQAGIRPSVYSLDGELLPDRLVLDHAHGRWFVFYFSERGTRFGEREFGDEDEACEHFYRHIVDVAEASPGMHSSPHGQA